MTLEEFAHEVFEMRALQRSFFAGRKEVLGESKRQERAVDEMLREVLGGQPSLFGRPKGEAKEGDNS